MRAPSRLHTRRWERIALAALILLLAGLPLAVWLDMQNIAAARLRSQAVDLNSMIASIRGYYSSAVVGRVLGNHGKDTQVIHNYETVPGAIPIPATLSLELGRVIADRQSNVSYRFISDYPFRGRAPHSLDEFEKNSLTALRARPDQPPSYWPVPAAATRACAWWRRC